VVGGWDDTIKWLEDGRTPSRDGRMGGHRQVVGEWEDTVK
jgi:hypothetical protein